MMKNHKKIIVIIFALSFLMMSTYCKENINELIQIDPDAMRVAGNYIATTFIIPGSADGHVDILANGGFITVILSLDFTARGRIVIPKHPSLRGDFDETFEGSYTVKNDSLQFKNMDNVLSNPQLYFIVKEKKLEGQLIINFSKDNNSRKD